MKQRHKNGITIEFRSSYRGCFTYDVYTREGAVTTCERHDRSKYHLRLWQSEPHIKADDLQDAFNWYLDANRQAYIDKCNTGALDFDSSIEPVTHISSITIV